MKQLLTEKTKKDTKDLRQFATYSAEAVEFINVTHLKTPFSLVQEINAETDKSTIPDARGEADFPWFYIWKLDSTTLSTLICTEVIVNRFRLSKNR